MYHQRNSPAPARTRPTLAQIKSQAILQCHHPLSHLLTSCPPILFSMDTLILPKRCEPGTYCCNGVRRLCPAGKFASSGDDNKHIPVAALLAFCTAGSTSPEEHPCPAGRFGQRGTWDALHVAVSVLKATIAHETHHGVMVQLGWYGSRKGSGLELWYGSRNTPRSCVGGVGGVSTAGNDGVSMAAVGSTSGSLQQP